MNQNSQSKSILKNYIYYLFNQFVNMLCPLIVTYYVSRVLGPQGIGRVSYAESITAYFVLFASLSITTYYGQRAISYVRDSAEERSRVFWETKIAGFIISLIVLVLYVFFAAFQNDKVLYIILSLMIFDVIFDVTWFYQGIEEFGKIVIKNTLTKVLSVFFILLFVKHSTDVYKYALGYVVFTVLGNISMWLYLPRYIIRIPIRSIKLFRDFRTMMSLFIPSIAINIYTVLDKTMIGLITGSSIENGYYEQAVKISKMSLTVITALGVVIIPRIGYYYIKGEKELVVKYMYNTYRFVWFLGIPLCMGLFGISDNLVPWFLGNDFSEVIPLLKILSFLVLAIGINNVTGVQYLIPTERQHLFTFTVVIGAFLNFLLNLILIKHYAAIGAAISSVLSETVISIIQIYLVRAEIKPIEIVRCIPKYLLAGFIMLGILVLENIFFVSNLINTVLMILSGGLVYLLVLFVLNDDYFLMLLDGTVRRISRN